MHRNTGYVRQGETRNDLGYVLGTYNDVGTIIPINGNMNSVKYIETLDNHLWPVVAKNFGNSTWIFQEDNTPCHCVKTM